MSAATHQPLRTAIDLGDSTAPQAVVVVLPAMGVGARSYVRFGERLTGAGAATPGSVCRVLIGEHRGQGDSPARPDRRTDWGYAQLVADAEQLVQSARRRFPDARVVLLGHSLGGQVAVQLLRRSPDAADALALLAAGTVHWGKFGGQTGVKLLGRTQLIGALSAVAGEHHGDRLGFGGHQPRTLIAQWAKAARTGRFPLADGPAPHPFTKPILCLRWDDDEWVTARAVHGLVNLLSPAGFLERVADGAGGHAGWLRTPEEAVDVVDAWLRADVLRA